MTGRLYDKSKNVKTYFTFPAAFRWLHDFCKHYPAVPRRCFAASAARPAASSPNRKAAEAAF